MSPWRGPGGARSAGEGEGQGHTPFSPAAHGSPLGSLRNTDAWALAPDVPNRSGCGSAWRVETFEAPQGHRSAAELRVRFWGLLAWEAGSGAHSLGTLAQQASFSLGPSTF